MTTNRMRAAPIVTLVLAFAVVFGLGKLIGPEVPGPGPDSHGKPTAQSPTAGPTDSPEPSSPADPSPTDSPRDKGLGVPDENGRVDLGRVTPGAKYPESQLELTVTPTREGRVQVCVRVPPDKQIRGDDDNDDWQQHDPPGGDRYCAYVKRNTQVDFTLVDW